MPVPEFDLYLVTDRGQTQRRDLLWVLQRALDGGVRAVQLREKDLQGKTLFTLAEKTRDLCRQYRAVLFINDRIDVAHAVEADGVQLGKTSLPIETARELLGPNRIIGVSTHSLEEARAAEREGADFILFGPVYYTASKVAYGAPRGLAALKKIVENIALPVYAIGGIKAENVAEVMGIGIRGISLISAVMAAVDPKTASQAIQNLLQRS
ncbi:MAG: thiamine phosphate synthase [Candidatus Binatia bacterium]